MNYKSIPHFAMPHFAAAALLACSPTWAANRLCVFDLLGSGGEMAHATKDFAVAMQATGTDLEVRAFTDERIAVEEFRTGQCQAVLATSFRTRNFNPITASIDALGASLILRQGQLDAPAGHEAVRMAIQSLSSAAAQSLVVQGKYETAAIIDVGAVYPLFNDRKINSPEAMAGKRMLAFDHDPAQAYVIQKAGAQPVSTDIINFASKFNNGLADIAAAPAVAFKPLELYKGVGTKGGISRLPYMIVTYQLIIDRSKFPAAFAPASRQYWLTHFDDVLVSVRKAESEVPANLWMDVSPTVTPQYAEFFRSTRMELAAKGYYNKAALKLMKRIRCKLNPADGECSTNSEVAWADEPRTP
jgi:hypothetical protein